MLFVEKENRVSIKMSLLNFSCVLILFFMCFQSENVGARTAGKRFVAPEVDTDHSDTASQLQVNYDEYPMVVPKRVVDSWRQAVVGMLKHNYVKGNDEPVYDENDSKLKPILLADEEEIFQSPSDDISERLRTLSAEPAQPEVKELKPENGASVDDLIEKSFQRRDQGDNSSSKGKNRHYWRCYFNAVTCF